MSAKYEKFAHSLQPIERWLPGNTLNSRRPLRNQMASRFLPDYLDGTLLKTKLPIDRTPKPNLEQVIASLHDAPELAALLGVCEDNLPLLLDLTDPASGAVLIIGDEESGKTALLRSMLISASRMNKTGQVILYLLVDQPDEYRDLSPSLQVVLPVEDAAVADLIRNLVQTTEARKHSGPQRPAFLLVIDDLPALLSYSKGNCFEELYWLIRHGPRYQVWTVASLPSDNVNQINPRFLTAFRTQLFGYMDDERLASRLALLAHLRTRRLEKSRQFYQPTGKDLLRFWLCQERKRHSIPSKGSNTEVIGGAA